MVAEHVWRDGARYMEALVQSRCLYAASRDGTVVNEHGGASIVPWWSFTKTVIAAGPELLDRVGAERPRYRPGTGWQYSNVSYLIVRQQIEQTTGVDLDVALRSLVLAPLGFDDIRLVTEPSDLHDVTMGATTGYHPGWVYHGLLGGPVRSAAVLLDRLIGTDFLAGEFMGQMLKPDVVGGPIEDRPWKVPGYGLGMMCGVSADVRVPEFSARNWHRWQQNP